MSNLKIGRLTLGQPSSPASEGMGDPISSVGGAVVPGTRTPMTVQFALNTILSGSSTLAQAQALRRGLRSLLNNAPLKNQGFLYVVYDDDTELNGWYSPDPLSLASPDGTAFKAVGLWQGGGGNWSVLGRQRTHREARSVWMKLLKAGGYERDYLGMLISTDFSTLAALPLTVLPSGASSIISSISGQVIATQALPTGRDGGIATLVPNLADLTVVSYERAESAMGLSDVITYDMRGRSIANWAPNPSFEQDAVGSTTPAGVAATAAGILNAGATFSVSSAQHAQGAHSLAITTTSGSSNQGAAELLSGGGTFVQGQVYTASVYMAGNAGAESVDIFFGWSGGGDATVQNVVLTAVGGGFTKYTVSWTPISSRASNVFLAVRTHGSSAYTWFLDGCLVTTGTSTTYVDGDTPLYLWNLNAGNSVTVGPGEEVYDTDYPWSWQSGGAADAPVLDNGLTRVRYDGVLGVPGLRVDYWNGTAWTEMGKFTFFRLGDSNGYCNAWASASVVEYTPERAVMSVVIQRTADVYSRERIFVTLQRGQIGCTVETYWAPKSNGTPADGLVTWSPFQTTADVNDSGIKIDSQLNPPPATKAAMVSTAGTGSAAWGNVVFGNSTFASSENYLTLLRYPSAIATVGPYQTNIAVQQGSAQAASTNDNSAYGTLFNDVYISSTSAAGYLFFELSWSTTVADQCFEAESVTLGTGTSSTADGAASNALAATATRTTDANPHVSKATWMAAFVGQYRVMARVKVSANQGAVYANIGAPTTTTVAAGSNAVNVNTFLGAGVLNCASAAAFAASGYVSVQTSGGWAIIAYTGKSGTTFTGCSFVAGNAGTMTTGQTITSAQVVTTSSTSYVWLDLGEILSSNATLEIHAWIAATGTISVDRVESFLTQDRANTGFRYSGARDLGQSVLYDARQLGALVAR